MRHLHLTFNSFYQSFHIPFFTTSLNSVCFVVVKTFFNRYINKLLKSKNDLTLNLPRTQLFSNI